MTREVRIALTETISVPADASVALEDIRSANVRQHVALIEIAAAAGANVVGLGELFPGPYFALEEDARWFGMAEDARTGPTVTELREVAQRLGVLLVAPLYELDSATGKRFNTAVVIERTGAVLGIYRKVHIPSGENERAAFHETFYYEPGDGRLGNGPANVSRNPHFPVFETSVGRVGVAICYDRHFPGVMSTLAREGAELVFCPAVTFGEQSRRMWDLEFAVDAARERLVIAGSNRRGAEEPWNVEFFGASYVVGPAGRAELDKPRPELLLATVDLDLMYDSDRSGWDLARDRRPGLYSEPRAE